MLIGQTGNRVNLTLLFNELGHIDFGQFLYLAKGSTMQLKQDARVFELLFDLQIEILNKVKSSLVNTGTAKGAPRIWHICHELSEYDIQDWLNEHDKKNISADLHRKLVTNDNAFKAAINLQSFPLCIRFIYALLRVPYARLALVDPMKEASPLQKSKEFLNLIVLLGGKMAVKGTGEADRVYKRILRSTLIILEQFNTKPDVFIAEYESFKQYTHILDQHVALFQARLRDVEIGKVASNKAMRLSTEIVEKSIAGHPQLGKAVRMILRDLWTKVLVYTQLSQGLESEAWKEQRLFVSRTVRHFGHISAMTNVEAFKKEFEQLWEIFTKHASTVINDFQIKCAQQDLRSGHLNLIDEIESKRNSTGIAKAVDVEICTTPEPEYTAANVMEPTHRISEQSIMTWMSLDQENEPASSVSCSVEAARFVDQIKEGDWLLVWLGESVPQPVQTLYRNEMDQTIIFVNHLGERVCEKSMSECASAFDHGHLARLCIPSQFDELIEAYQLERSIIATKLVSEIEILL